MTPEATPMFVYERAMPAIGPVRCPRRMKILPPPIAGMARSYTRELSIFHANGHDFVRHPDE